MYNYKSNTFTNICTEKNSYTSLKNKNSKIFFCFFEKKHKKFSRYIDGNLADAFK